MPAGHGVRARTRDTFARPFRGKGYINLTTYLRSFKLGDYVDIKVNGAVHSGMPHKYYHGKTGVVWNVTKRAVGVEIYKQHNGRIIPKRLHVRVEHVHPSRCKEDFLARVKANDAFKHAAKERGEKAGPQKRAVAGPRKAFTLENVTLETITAIPYDILKEGLKN